MNCDLCQKEYSETMDCYELDNGDYVCYDCYQDRLSAREYAYEDYREAEATGN